MNGEQQLQAETPGHGSQADGPAIGRPRHRDRRDEGQPDQWLESFHSCPLSVCGSVQFGDVMWSSTSGEAGGASPMTIARARAAGGPRRARGRRCSEARAAGRPRATRSPGFRRSVMPAAGSTASPAFSRPAPSSIDARPTSSASSRWQMPGRRRGDTLPLGGLRQPGRDRRRSRRRRPDGGSSRRTSPARRRKLSASRTRRSASSARLGAARELHHARREPNDQRLQVGRAPALSASRRTRQSPAHCRPRRRAARPSR